MNSKKVLVKTFEELFMNNSEYDKLKLENQLCFPLYVCSKEIIRRYKPYLNTLDLTYTQYIVMLVFWEQKKISVKELGKKLFLDSGTLTPVLKSLEKKEYISRYRSTEDERILLAEITENGEILKKKAVEIPSRIVECMQLESDEAMQLYKLLYKVISVFGEY